MFEATVRGCSVAVLLGISLAFVACGGSTEDGSGGGGQGATGGTGGTAGSGGSAGEAGSGGSAGEAGSGGAAGEAGSGGSAGEAGSGGAAGSAGQSGDCSENDPGKVCPDNGSTCTELVPGGFTVCALAVEEATSCTSSGMDDCCDSSECDEGACYPYPAYPSCGGAQPPEMNVCASDYCQDDSDCQNPGEQFCAPRGVNNNAVRYCMPKMCTTDADCTAKAGGNCAPVRNPCCGSWTGLFCVYPDGCRTDADCDDGQYCDVNWDDGTGECMDGGPMCPA